MTLMTTPPTTTHLQQKEAVKITIFVVVHVHKVGAFIIIAKQMFFKAVVAGPEVSACNNNNYSVYKAKYKQRV